MTIKIEVNNHPKRFTWLKPLPKTWQVEPCLTCRIKNQYLTARLDWIQYAFGQEYNTNQNKRITINSNQTHPVLILLFLSKITECTNLTSIIIWNYHTVGIFSFRHRHIKTRSRNNRKFAIIQRFWQVRETLTSAHTVLKTFDIQLFSLFTWFTQNVYY